MRYLLAACLCVLSFTVTGQVFKFRTFQTAKYKRNDTDTALKWNPYNILVVINLDTERIKIYAKDVFEGDILKPYKLETRENGDKHLTFKMVDETGSQLDVELISYVRTDGNRHIATLDRKSVV